MSERRRWLNLLQTSLSPRLFVDTASCMGSIKCGTPCAPALRWMQDQLQCFWVVFFVFLFSLVKDRRHTWEWECTWDVVLMAKQTGLTLCVLGRFFSLGLLRWSRYSRTSVTTVRVIGHAYPGPLSVSLWCHCSYCHLLSFLNMRPKKRKNSLRDLFGENILYYIPPIVSESAV